MAPATHTISGTVRFEDVRRPIDATVYVRVEEAGRLDAAATRIAETVLPGVHVEPGSAPIPFTVRGVPAVPSGRTLVRVHADVDGDGRISRGDFVSMQSYPVATDADRDGIAIVVREVR
jgi:uncharacterized lipoprotein YbaY